MGIGQTDEEKYTETLLVANAMIRFGGSFVKLLGQALLHADHINTEKIKRTFSDYWIKYLTMAQQDKQRKED